MKYLLISLLSFLPYKTFAFSLRESRFDDVVFEIVNLLSMAVPLLFAMALVLFFWGLSKFIINSSNEAELNKGKNYMLWGILALFILISFRTIVGIIVRDLEFGDGKTVPQLPTSGTVESVNSNVNYINNP